MTEFVHDAVPAVRSRGTGPPPFASLLVAVTVLAGAMGQAKVPDPLTQARDLYNQAHYDDAIEKATAARGVPALADGAGVVLARAHLDRYRKSADASDLVDARTALKSVDVSKLSLDDRVGLAIARGESLYLDDSDAFDDRYSAAAEEFEIAMGHADTLDERNRDALFDWWAGSLDREAQQGPEADRKAIYARILARAADEVAKPNGSAAASYWLPVGARGVDDLSRAVGAAVAGWVRGGTMGARGVALRQDLDRLMRQVILPERALELAGNEDPRPGLAALITEWDELKAKW